MPQSQNKTGAKQMQKAIDAGLIEIESGRYSNRQQIADMIQEKYNVKVCLNTVSNFLKKRNQAVKMRFAACES